MEIDTPLRELGPVDIDAMRDAVLAQDEIAWAEDRITFIFDYVPPEQVASSL